MFQKLKKFAVLALVGLAFSPLSAAAEPPRFVGSVGDTLCGPTDYAKINSGKYIVYNGIWNAQGNGTADQCIEVTPKGFISRKMNVRANGGAPLTYPSVKLGCSEYGCNPGSQFPLRASDPLFKKLHTRTQAQTPNAGKWNAAYDLFFRPDSKPGFDGSVLEFMIWYNYRTDDGREVRPIGKLVGTAQIDDATWDVWYGPHPVQAGQSTVSYVRQEKTNSVDFLVEDFYADAVRRNFASRDWYLNWINTGFEVWNGALGLNIVDFSMDYNGRPTGASGGSGTGGEAGGDSGGAAGPAPKPSPTPSEETKNIRCAVTTSVLLQWKGGYVLQGKVMSSADSPKSSWHTWLQLPEGQWAGGFLGAQAKSPFRWWYRLDSTKENSSLAPQQTRTWTALVFHAVDDQRTKPQQLGCAMK
ncbi:MAG: GH12 family glycosyl hydrolase domain-containing protein [Angustibacter sp.]